MRKRQKTMLIAAVALAVIVAAVVCLILFAGEPATEETAPETTVTTAPEEPAILVIDRTLNAQGGAVQTPVQAMAIRNEKNTFNVIRRSDTTLAVEAYSDLLTDSLALETLSGHAAKLEAVKRLEAVDNAAEFGFDTPTATVTVTYYDQSTATIEFGDASQGTEGYYCRLQGEDTVYIVDKVTAECFMVEGKDLIGKGLISSPPLKEDDKEGTPQLLKLWLTGRCREKPVEITVDTEGQYKGLTYVSTFVMTSPYLRAVDSDAFHVTASTMRTLTAAGVECPHPTAEQLAAYGLDDPYSVAAFTLSIVSTASAEGGATKSTHYNDREHMILLGNKDENGNYYALVDGYDTVYLLSPASVPWAEQTHYDLMSKLLFMKAITAVDSITVTKDGEAQTFALAHHPEEEKRDDQLTVTSGGKTYSTSDFRTLYQMMIGIHRVGLKEAGAAADGSPVLKLEMTFNDGTAPMSVALYPMTASRYLCVTDDGEECAVSIRDTETFFKQYENYLAGEPVLSPY